MCGHKLYITALCGNLGFGVLLSSSRRRRRNTIGIDLFLLRLREERLTRNLELVSSSSSQSYVSLYVSSSLRSFFSTFSIFRSSRDWVHRSGCFTQISIMSFKHDASSDTSDLSASLSNMSEIKSSLNQLKEIVIKNC